MRPIVSILMPFLWFFFMFACSDMETIKSEKAEIVVRGLDSETNNRSAGDEAQDDFSLHQILFTGDNIKWYNPTTREMKFNGIEPREYFSYHKRIVFELNGEQLFTTFTALPIYSFTCADLVLFFDNGKYYLNNCYPDWMINHEETKKNLEKQQPGLNKFIAQLKKEKKLRY